MEGPSDARHGRAEYAGQKVAYDLRNGLYDRIQRLSFAFHDKNARPDS